MKGFSPRERLADLLDAPPMELAARFTLVMLLFNPRFVGNWYLQAPLLVACGLGVLSPRFGRSPLLWSVVALLMTRRMFETYFSADNHYWLLTYWCWTLALWRFFPAAVSMRNARLLIGLAFAFATLWKVGLSSDFMSGDFFRRTLLVDTRFEELTRLAGIVDEKEWNDNRKAYVEARRLMGGRPQAELYEPAGLRALAVFSTWWTAILEGTLAAAFLVPTRSPLSRWRHALLLVFAASTYPFATVTGFGWLLMTLGVAQCEPERVRTRVLYTAMFFAVLLFRVVPWAVPLLEARGT